MKIYRYWIRNKDTDYSYFHDSYSGAKIALVRVLEEMKDGYCPLEFKEGVEAGNWGINQYDLVLSKWRETHGL